MESLWSEPLSTSDNRPSGQHKALCIAPLGSQWLLNVGCSPQAHVFEHLVPIWWCCFRRCRKISPVGGSISEEVDLDSLKSLTISRFLSLLCACGSDVSAPESCLPAAVLSDVMAMDSQPKPLRPSELFYRLP